MGTSVRMFALNTNNLPFKRGIEIYIFQLYTFPSRLLSDKSNRQHDILHYPFPFFVHKKEKEIL